MKKTLKALVLSSVALGTWCAASPAARATVMVDDIVTPSATEDPFFASGGENSFQVFSTPGGTGNYSTISSVSFVFYNNGYSGSAPLTLYLVSSSGATLGTIGTYSSFLSVAPVSKEYAVATVPSSLAYELQYGTSYYLELKAPTFIRPSGYNSAPASSGGPGSIGVVYLDNLTTSDAPNNIAIEIDVSPIPEVPCTGVFMGFGALCLAFFSRVRQSQSAPNS